jgi:hypothetical protein
VIDLRREQHFVPLAILLERAPDHALGLTGGVHIARVEQVHPGIDRHVEHARRLVLRRGVEEVVGTHSNAGDLQASPTQVPVLHNHLLRDRSADLAPGGVYPIRGRTADSRLGSCHRMRMVP